MWSPKQATIQVAAEALTLLSPNWKLNNQQPYQTPLTPKKMKAKVIITLLVCAVVTLSFTFSSTHKAEKKSTQTSSVNSNEAVGGLGSVDPIK
jgi:hypothetical protein